MPGLRRVDCLLVGALLAFALFFATGTAHAHPWMIRHGYSACQTCHVDPSGAGILTAYGRAIETLVLATGPDDKEEEARAGFLFNAVKLPEWLNLDADLRALWLRSKVPGTQLTDRLIFMQADAQAAIQVSNFVASASLGFAPEGALGAVLTRGTENNLVSRQHWLGYSFGSGNWMARAGRMNLPYGIRTIEHTLWAKDRTRTSINDDQQFGASVFYSGDQLRAELMLILGNFQLRPDDYRERGYSGYAEWLPISQLGLGVSSLVTHRDLDTANLKETWRQTHGIFGRWATPWEPLVVQTEWNYSNFSSKGEFDRRGTTGFIQADLEATKGLHVLATAEAMKLGAQRRFVGYGAWLSFWWFFMPHVDIRLDSIYQTQGAVSGRFGTYTMLLQGHVSL
jgi:hypothetical protein